MMKAKPIHLFNQNDTVKIEKLLFEKEDRETFQALGILQGAQAEILWKSGKKIILKTEENKLALSERAAETILASGL